MKKLTFAFLTIAVLMVSRDKYNNEVPANGRGTIKFAINPLSTGADGRTLAEVADPSYLSFTLTNEAGERVSHIRAPATCNNPFAIAVNEPVRKPS